MVFCYDPGACNFTAHDTFYYRQMAEESVDGGYVHLLKLECSLNKQG